VGAPSLSGSPGASPPVRYVNAYWAGSVVVLVRRTDEGRFVRTTVPADYACFVRTAELEARPELVTQLRTSRYVKGMRAEPDGFTRISWLTRDAVLRACGAEYVRRGEKRRQGWFEALGLEVFEGDVDPVRRWMVDTGASVARPRRVYFDIETDSRIPFSRMEEMRVLCWSLVSAELGPDGEPVLRRHVLLESDDDDAERRLLVALWKALENFDQVASWNGDRFDFRVIRARTERLGIPVDPRRLLWLDQMVLFQRMNASAAESGDEKQSLALGAVAAALDVPDAGKLVRLGEVGGPTTWGMWEAGGEERVLLGRYCEDDADKQRKIEERTGYCELLQSIAESTNTFPDSRGVNPTRFVEGFLLRLGRERGMHFPTWRSPGAVEGEEETEEQDQFKGAFVLEPTRVGIVRDVHVCDFSRLYPSIIVSWNMSLETIRPDVRLVESSAARPSYLSHLPLKRFPLPAGHCAAPLTDVVFANEPEGILPLAVSEMLRLRAYWDDRKKNEPPGTPAWKEADRRSAAYKICANAFYGVIGSPWSRFFVRELAESVAQGGVYLIHETIREAERRGMRALYGDTDSVFVTGTTRGGFDDFVAWCNAELYPRLLREKGCTRASVKLAYEKAFEILVMIGKKRYAGRYAHYKGKAADASSKPEIKGLEYKRGDAVRLARRMQAETIDLLLSGEEDASAFVALVERYRVAVLDGELDLADVAQSKRLSKGLREYAVKVKKDGTKQAPPPHVVVGRMLAERGRDVGAGVRIEYLVVDGSSDPVVYAPSEDWKGECDRFYLWEKQVYPPTLRVLQCAFPATEWARWERVRPAKARGAPQPGTPALFEGKLLKQKPRDVAPEGSTRRRAGSAKGGSDKSRQGDLF
jgi:DNA polymerase elongation subunit (family B)